MGKRCLYFLMLSFVLLFIGCKKDGEPGDENNPENPMESEIPEEFKDSYLDTTIQIDGANAAEFYKDCYVNSIFDEVAVSDGSIKLQSNINKKVQTYFLTDGGDKIYQMTRVSDTEKNKKIDFSAESTALAFVTFHPLFASIDSVAYDILEEVILQSENFPKVRTEINNLIKKKKDLYSEDNIPLFDALDSLLDELVVFANYKPAEETTSRTITNETMYYPFKINSSGRRLDFQVFGLNPNYYGTATHADGSVENLVVESHEDFGFLASLECVLNVLNNKGLNTFQYGKVKSYSFPSEGECKFHFSCKTKQNEADLALRILASICEMIGINEDLGKIAQAGNLTVFMQEIQNSSYELAMPSFPFYNASGQIAANLFFGEVAEVIKKGLEKSYNIEIAEQEKLKSLTDTQYIKDGYDLRIKALKESQSRIGRAMKTYTLAKGILNVAVRLIAAQKASDPVDFKFCNYDNNVHFCSQLWKVKGDNQTGIYGEKLSEPISVALNVDMGNHSAYVLKFEVCKGGGTVGESGKKEEYVELGDFDNVVNTVWRMGSDSKEQMMRVYLCEKETKEVVCEPVEFMATAVDKCGIYIVDGNNQIGKPNKALPKKLQVGLTNSELFDTSEFRVQFEVVEGSGSVTPQYAELSGGITECTWFLGHKNEKQKVKAVLVSSLIYEELSEPVYFEANFEKEDALREALVKLYNSTNGDNWTRNDNWCSDLPVSSWYGCSLKYYDDKSNQWIQVINLANNNLTGKIDLVFTLDSPIELWLNNNQLESIDVSESSSLHSLSVYNNPIVYLKATDCTNMGSISCKDNQQLKLIDVSGCKGLRSLFCEDNNNLTSLYVFECIDLKTLLCRNTKIISEIPDWFSQLHYFWYDRRYQYGSRNGKLIWHYANNGYGWYNYGEPYGEPE